MKEELIKGMTPKEYQAKYYQANKVRLQKIHSDYYRDNYEQQRKVKNQHHADNKEKEAEQRKIRDKTPRGILLRKERDARKRERMANDPEYKKIENKKRADAQRKRRKDPALRLRHSIGQSIRGAMNKIKKTCHECGDPLPKHKQKFCGKKCQDISTNRTLREKRATDPQWREKYNARTREYYNNSPEKREKVKEHGIKYRTDHRESFKAARRVSDRARRSTPEGRLENSISCCIRAAMRELGTKKDSRTLRVIGLSQEGFRKWIENQFTEGMSFSNYGRTSVKKGEPYWELDHIVPESFSKLGKDKEEKEKFVRLLNHHTNLRPLWREHPNVPSHLLNGSRDGGKGDKLILELVSPELKIRLKDIIERALEKE